MNENNNNNPDHSLIAEYVRRRLFCTFYVFYSCNNVLLENTSDLRNSRKRTRPKKINHCISARTTETGKFKYSTTLLSDINYRHLDWSRAVKNLSDDCYRAWIYYCYADQLDFDFQIVICRRIWSEFNSTLFTQQKKIRTTTLELLKKLVFLAVQNAVYKIKNDRDYYNRKTLARLAKKSISGWRENYNSHWNQLLKICYKLDYEALINVSNQKRTQNN